MKNNMHLMTMCKKNTLLLVGLLLVDIILKFILKDNEIKIANYFWQKNYLPYCMAAIQTCMDIPKCVCMSTEQQTEQTIQEWIQVSAQWRRQNVSR